MATASMQLSQKGDTGRGGEDLRFLMIKLSLSSHSCCCCQLLDLISDLAWFLSPNAHHYSESICVCGIKKLSILNWWRDSPLVFAPLLVERQMEGILQCHASMT